jgi:predicted TPR repeat methyltransferase
MNALEALLNEADQALVKGDLNHAQICYEKADNQNSNNEAVKYNLSLIYLQQNNIEKAINLLEPAVQALGSFALWGQLGNAYRRAPQIDLAIKAYQHSLNLKPNTNAYNNLGLIYLEQNKANEAEECFKEALNHDKANFSSMFNLALAYKANKKEEDAAAVLLTLIKADEKNGRAYFVLGKLLLELNRFQEANHYFYKLASLDDKNISVFESIVGALLDKNRYIEARPYCETLAKLSKDNVEITYNLAVIAEKERQVEKAIAYYHEVLLVSPKHFNSLNNVAVIYLEKQDLVSAKMYFERAIKLQPHNKSIRYTLGAITGEHSVDQAPKEYIASLFDHYAGHFDQHLQEGLEYKVPELLRGALDAFFGLNKQKLNIVDLGCGTGLAGEALKPYIQTITGVDLSQKMLDEADKKQLYKALIHEDIVTYLKSTDEVFELVIAADVLVYLGNLTSLFESLTKSLRGGGLFAFSVEVVEGTKFTLQKTGRFAHTEKYLSDLAKTFHFEVRYCKGEITRMQNNQPVYGAILIFQKMR